MRYRFKYNPVLMIALIALIGTAMMFAAPTLAADLKAGTVIDAKNLDEMKPQTFEGKTIASMLTEKIEWWVRNHNLQITLRNSEPFPVDPRWIEATNKYSAEVKFDPSTRNVTGYKAGLAFPNITDDDPNKADKLIWNFYLTGGWPRPSFQHIPLFRFIFIDGKRGVEQTQTWTFEKIWMAGNLTGDPVLGDGSVYFKQLIMALEPFDIRGVGSFKIRSTDGRPDDSWVYARSVRRTRRLSGGGWYDPIGGTDQLNDEVSIFSAYPNWFPAYKYHGKRTVLAIAHTQGDSWDGKSDSYPYIDTKNPPYFNPVDVWEPREVFVIEATMPDEHVYSKRIYYIDCEGWVPYYSEAYDKKGEFVKLFLTNNMVEPGLQNPQDIGLRDPAGHTIDFKRMHATVYVWGANWRRNPPMGPNDVSVAQMEGIAQGKFTPPDFPDPTFKHEPKYMKDFNVNWSTYKLK